MNIILLERVEKLGKLGDIVSVKPGYARNYLLPSGKALRASKANMEKFEAERAEREQKNAVSRTAAEQRSGELDGLAINLVRAASEMGQLFGSVTARDIADAVTASGQPVERRQVVMDNAIKTLGLFPIKVTLHAEVTITVTVNIARSLEEAETQLQIGRAVIASDQDDMEDNYASSKAVAAMAKAEAAGDASADEAAAEETTANEDSGETADDNA
ncbi:50S ribosomal protein L9 [Alphaproteobacteria bacterium]|nr:50S ribosomal protein L9 [Alphaproteobacteria bacterium]